MGKTSTVITVSFKNYFALSLYLIRMNQNRKPRKSLRKKLEKLEKLVNWKRFCFPMKEISLSHTFAVMKRFTFQGHMSIERFSGRYLCKFIRTRENVYWGPVHTKTIVNANASKRIFLSPSTRKRSSFT